MTVAPLRSFSLEAWHRLIPSRYSEGDRILAALTARGDAASLERIKLLDRATDSRAQAEQHGLIGISTFELVYGIPHAQIVNGAFTHPNEAGSRFNDHTRGAWYAADRVEASLAEVVYHKALRLAEIVVPREAFGRPSHDISNYCDWQADFNADFHVLDPPETFAECLRPEPVPQCYAASQALARALLARGSNGLVYPSVRYAGSQCIACFRPALVYHPRPTQGFEITFRATEAGYDTSVAPG